MRKFKDAIQIKRQNEQVKYFIDLLTNAETKNEIRAIVNTVIMSSERVLIAQRLEILRMLNEGKTYYDIERKIKVSPCTISNSIDQYMKHGNDNEFFNKVLMRTKKKIVSKTKPTSGSKSLLVNPWYKKKKRYGS